MSTLHRALATLASSALALSLVSGGVADAQPAARGTTPQASAGATWLGHQLTKGLIHNGQYDFDDYGLTADTALALRAIGGHTMAQAKIRHALARHVDDYTTYRKSVFAGSVAKLLVVAQQNGGSGHHFGGVDLVRRLAKRVITSGPATGRIQDKGASDYANTIGQIFAVRGLISGRGRHAADALSFLESQQCDAGYLRLDFAKSRTAAKQSCDAGAASTSAPDTDATALFVVELSSVSSRRPPLTLALRQAVRWLLKHQATNGSFGGGTTTVAPNTNSTGLAAWALGIAGRCSPARKAAAWVAKKQVGSDVAGSPLAGEAGAIAYDGAALRAGERDGITVKTRDQWRRATTQAAPGLTYLTAGACQG